jgi:hypothetical protein
MHQNEFDDYNWFPDHPFSQPTKPVTRTIQGQSLENAGMLSVSKSDNSETSRQDSRDVFLEISNPEMSLRA